MIIDGHQIDETEVLDIGQDGSVFTVSDLIEYALNNPTAFREKEDRCVCPSYIWWHSESGLCCRCGKVRAGVK